MNNSQSLSDMIPGPIAGKLPDFLLKAVDFSLAAVIFIAPLVMGGRHPVGRFLFVLLVCVAAVSWFTRQCFLARPRWRKSGVEWLIVAGLALVAGQLVPLPPTWLSWLSPAVYEHLPLWAPGSDAPVNLGQWSQLSLTPEATRDSLAMFAAYAMLFLIIVQRIERTDDIERWMRWLALAAITMGTLGLAQYFFGNGRFLWVYEHPTRNTFHVAKGAFSNANHFAQFMALGVGPIFWWIQHVFRRRDHAAFELAAPWNRAAPAPYVKTMLLVALGLVAFAGMLSLSAGGMVAMFVAATTSVAICAWRNLLGKRSVLALGVAGVCLAAALTIHGFTPVAVQLGKFQVGSVSQFSDNLGRDKIWAADLRASRDYRLTGSGIGSHREVYPTYFPGESDVEYTHAESGFLQLLLESGILGITLWIAGLGIAGAWAWRVLRRSDSSRTTACAAAISAGLTASLVHSTVDFVWYIPACMSLVVIQLAILCRLNHLVLDAATGQRDVHMPRVAWLVATGVILVVVTTMTNRQIGPALASPHWERYLALSLASNRFDPSRADLQQHVDPRDPETVALMQSHLEKTLQHHPHDARAHVRMSAVLLRRFELAQQYAENAMGLAVVRDAALDSKFSTRESLDRWLAVAVGENCKYLDLALFHAHRGLQLCPLQGEAYTYLAELSFLEGMDRRAKAAYVDQALRVRPHHGAVQLAAGREAALIGDLPRALGYWKRAFHQGAEYRDAIIAIFGNQMPASFFLTSFEPDLMGLAALFGHFKQTTRDDETRQIAGAYADALEDAASGQPEAGQLWHQAHQVWNHVGEEVRATECLEKAIRARPRDYAWRRSLALRLNGQRRYEEAVEHVRWCLARVPSDGSIQDALKTARRGIIEQASAPVGVSDGMHPDGPVAIDARSPG